MSSGSKEYPLGSKKSIQSLEKAIRALDLAAEGPEEGPKFEEYEDKLANLWANYTYRPEGPDVPKAAEIARRYLSMAEANYIESDGVWSAECFPLSRGLNVIVLCCRCSSFRPPYTISSKLCVSTP